VRSETKGLFLDSSRPCNDLTVVLRCVRNCLRIIIIGLNL